MNRYYDPEINFQSPIYYQLKSLHDAREAHECHCEQAGGNQCNRCSFHAFRNFHQTHLFTQSRKENSARPKPIAVENAYTTPVNRS